MYETKDIFISHNWGLDLVGIDNHKRCKKLADELIHRGYSVWFDDNDMIKNIDNKIMDGISNSKIVLICLTEKYCKKIENGIKHQIINDNCYKEWNYILLKSKKIIPIIMEKDLMNKPCSQIIQMYINSIFYIDMSESIYDNIQLLCKDLKEYKIYSKNQITAFEIIINNIRSLLKFYIN